MYNDSLSTKFSTFSSELIGIYRFSVYTQYKLQDSLHITILNNVIYNRLNCVHSKYSEFGPFMIFIAAEKNKFISVDYLFGVHMTIGFTKIMRSLLWLYDLRIPLALNYQHSGQFT